MQRRDFLKKSIGAGALMTIPAIGTFGSTQDTIDLNDIFRKYDVVGRFQDHHINVKFDHEWIWITPYQTLDYFHTHDFTTDKINILLATGTDHNMLMGKNKNGYKKVRLTKVQKRYAVDYLMNSLKVPHKIKDVNIWIKPDRSVFLNPHYVSIGEMGLGITSSSNVKLEFIH